MAQSLVIGTGTKKRIGNLISGRKIERGVPQPTSGESGSRREAGEEFFAEREVPLVDQMPQPARCRQFSPTWRAAELVQCDRPHATMAGARRIVLAEQSRPRLQRGGLAAQPGENSPNGHVVQRSFVDRCCHRRRLVADHGVNRADRTSIRLNVVLQEAAGQLEQRGAGVTFIGEYESRGNR